MLKLIVILADDTDKTKNNSKLIICFFFLNDYLNKSNVST